MTFSGFKTHTFSTVLWFSIKHLPARSDSTHSCSILTSCMLQVLTYCRMKLPQSAVSTYINIFLQNMQTNIFSLCEQKMLFGCCWKMCLSLNVISTWQCWFYAFMIFLFPPQIFLNEVFTLLPLLACKPHWDIKCDTGLHKQTAWRSLTGLQYPASSRVTNGTKVWVKKMRERSKREKEIETKPKEQRAEDCAPPPRHTHTNQQLQSCVQQKSAEPAAYSSALGL